MLRIMPICNTYRHELQRLAGTLENAWNFNRVVIDKNEETERCSISYGFNFQQLLPDIFSCFKSAVYKEENRHTIQYFYDIFGEERLNRLFTIHGLDLRRKYIHGIALTRHDVEQILASTGLVFHEDLKDIFFQIQQNPHNYLHLSSNELNNLYVRFQGKKFKNLTKDDTDILYDIACPLDLKTMFLNNDPGRVKWNDRWKTWKGMKKTIYMMEQVRRNPTASNLEKLYRGIKRRNASEIPRGLVLPGHDGYRFVKEVIAGSGITAVLQQSLNKVDGVLNSVSILGTKASWWESVIEDFRPNLGSVGPMSIYNLLHRYLSHSSKGFVEIDREKFNLEGMSLGGAQAVHLAALFAGRVNKMTLFCNPGVGENLTDWYANRYSYDATAPLPGIDTEAKEWHRDRMGFKTRDDAEDPEWKREQNRNLNGRMTMHYVWEADDTVTCGGKHIGAYADPNKMNVKLTMLSPLKDDEEINPNFPERPKVPESFFGAIWRMYQSLYGPHIRDTLQDFFSIKGSSADDLKTYRVFSISNENAVSRDLLDRALQNIGPDGESLGWEKFRREWFTWILGEEHNFIHFLNTATELERRRSPNQHMGLSVHRNARFG